MPLSALQGLLGLAGGAQGFSGGLADLSRRKEAHDQERKHTALQLLLSGWRPTPTAQNNPNATGYAHSNGAVDVLNDLRTAPPVTWTGGDGYRVSQGAASSTPSRQSDPFVQIMSQPETIDVPDLGSYSQTPQAALHNLLSIQAPLANIRHLNAETNALENPQPKPRDVAYTPADFTVNGQAVHGFATSTGEYVDANRQPVRGQVTPYRAPTQAAPKYGNFKRPDGQTVTVPMEEGVRQGWVEVPLGGAGAGFSSAQVMARSGQFGEMLKKTADLIPAMDALDVGAGQSSARDIATHGVKVLGLDVPGARAAGELLMSRDPKYSAYQAALDPWVLAAGHTQTSRGGVTQSQLDAIRRSVERGVADPDATVMQKRKNMVDYLNTVAASLSPDDVAAQEAQMPPAILAELRQWGYKGASIAGTNQAPGQSASQAAPPSPKPKMPQSQYDILVTRGGLTDAHIRELYGNSYDLSEIVPAATPLPFAPAGPARGQRQRPSIEELLRSP